MDIRLDHVHIFADDPAGMARWLGENLGGEVLEYLQSDGRKRIDVRFGGMRLYISAPPADAGPLTNGRRRGMDHLGFAVENVDATVATLRARGAIVVDPPSTPRPGVRNAFLVGPEGIRIEIMRRDPIDYGEPVRGLTSPSIG